jgi:hypothetical protein
MASVDASEILDNRATALMQHQNDEEHSRSTRPEKGPGCPKEKQRLAEAHRSPYGCTVSANLRHRIRQSVPHP